MLNLKFLIGILSIFIFLLAGCRLETTRFDLVKNDGQILIIDVTGIVEKAKGKLTYSMVIDEHRFDEQDRQKLHLEYRQKNGMIQDSRINIDTASLGSGTYTFNIYKNDETIWEQDVYVVAKKNWPDKLKNEQNLDQIASNYSPVLMYNEQEEYFPVSIPYLANKELSNPDLDKETYKIRGSFLIGYAKLPYASIFNKDFKCIMDRLPYWGDRRTSLNLSAIQENNLLRSFRYRTRSMMAKHRKGDRENSNIYYSFLRDYERDENKYIEKNRYFLFYHFLYAFDPKDGRVHEDKDGNKIFGLEFGKVTGHIYDRESMAIVFESDETGNLKPIEVVYGAHLANQTMGLGNPEKKDEFLQTWDGGRVKFGWNHPRLTKVGSHPIIAIAKGSHAVYPFPGTYNVIKRGPLTNHEYEFLEEVAGPTNDNFDSTVLLPEDLNNGTNNQVYELLSLKTGRHTSSDPHYGLLVYSGSLVDLPMPIKAKFPPFTDREREPADWVDGAYNWSSEPGKSPRLSVEFEKYLKSLKEKVIH